MLEALVPWAERLVRVIEEQPAGDVKGLERKLEHVAVQVIDLEGAVQNVTKASARDATRLPRGHRARYHRAGTPRAS